MRPVAETFLSRILSALIQAGLLVVVARTQEKEQFGVFATALAVTLAISVVVEFGVDKTAVSKVSRGNLQAGRDLTQAHATAQMVSALAVWVSISTLAHFSNSLTPEVAVIGLLAATERLLYLSLAQSVALNAAARAAYTLTVSRLAAAFIFFAMFHFGVPSTLSYVISFAATSVIAAAYLHGDLRSSTVRPTLEHSLRVAIESREESGHYWRSTLYGQVRQQDLLIASMLGGPLVAASYALPARAVSPLRLVATSISTSTFPIAARRDKGELKIYLRATLVASIAMVAATAALWAIGPSLAAAIAGQDYRSAGEVLRVLLVGVCFSIPGTVFSSILQGFGDGSFISRVGLGSAIIFLAAITVGTILVGPTGAAWGATSAYVAEFLVVGARLLRRYKQIA